MGILSVLGSTDRAVRTAMSSADRAALDAASGVYTDAIPYAGVTSVGRAVAIIATAAGSATLTFASGNTMVVPASVGLTIVPFGCTNAVQTTGTLTTFKLT